MSVATVQTASSSPTSPSSSSVTHTFSMPSDSRMRISSSLITCPFARSFFPPDRKTVQQRILPFELLTSTVFALMSPHWQFGPEFIYPSLRRVRLYKDKVRQQADILGVLFVYLWTGWVSPCGHWLIVRIDLVS